MPKKHKKYCDLFDLIIDEDNIYKAYKKALNGKGKYHIEAMRFAQDEIYNLQQLRQSLINGTYIFDGYINFTVTEPKKRVIDAPHFKDKIVQLAINNVLKEIYNPKFIYDSYGSIDNKGTHVCAERIQYFIRKAKWLYGEDAFIVKIDIKKFFYSIDREILKTILAEIITCPRTLDLLYLIIDSANVIDLLGVPLGNTISQLCANIYMNKLDQYCKRVLGLKFYVRYMDDCVIVVDDREKAKIVLELVRIFTEDILHLKLNENKSKIFPINQGVNVVGYKIYATHRLLRNDSKKKIKRKAKAMPKLIANKKLTIEKAEQMLNSWNGHASHASSYNFIEKLIKKNDFIYKVKKGNKTVLKIDVIKLEVYFNGNN